MAEKAQQETVFDTGASRNRLAKVYAEALLAVADSKKETDTVVSELETLVSDVIMKDQKVASFLNSPAVNKKAKEPVIQQAFSGKCSETLKNFLSVLNANGRLALLPAIRASVRDITDARANRLRVKVTSAVALNNEQQEKIKQALKAALNKEPVLSVQENPDLLGGLVVQFGDKVVDSSVRSRLDSLRAALMTQGSSYVLQN